MYSFNALFIFICLNLASVLLFYFFILLRVLICKIYAWLKLYRYWNICISKFFDFIVIVFLCGLIDNDNDNAFIRFSPDGCVHLISHSLFLFIGSCFVIVELFLTMQVLLIGETKQTSYTLYCPVRQNI